MWPWTGRLRRQPYLSAASKCVRISPLPMRGSVGLSCTSPDSSVQSAAFLYLHRGHITAQRSTGKHGTSHYITTGCQLGGGHTRHKASCLVEPIALSRQRTNGPMASDQKYMRQLLGSSSHRTTSPQDCTHRCSIVLPCTTTAAAPACCSRRTTRGALSFFSDSPVGQKRGTPLSRPKRERASQVSTQILL